MRVEAQPPGQLQWFSISSGTWLKQSVFKYSRQLVEGSRIQEGKLFVIRRLALRLSLHLQTLQSCYEMTSEIMNTALGEQCQMTLRHRHQ